MNIEKQSNEIDVNPSRKRKREVFENGTGVNEQENKDDEVETSWMSMYKKLKMYKLMFGNISVPYPYPVDPKLGEWVFQLRRKSKTQQEKRNDSDCSDSDESDSESDDEGRDTEHIVDLPSSLIVVNDERKSLLATLGFTIDVDSLTDQCNNTVQGDDSEERKRRKRNKNKRKKKKKKRKLLQNIGKTETIESNNPKPASGQSVRVVWENHFKDLLSFKKEFGHYDVPRRYAKNLPLGRWVTQQREDYSIHQSKKSDDDKTEKSIPGNMIGLDEKVSRLNDIGFVWDVLKKNWMDKYSQLLDFKKEFGHVNVPRRYPQNVSLGVWVQAQRTQYHNRKERQAQTQNNLKNSSVSSKTEEQQQYQIELLEKIGFQWSTGIRQGTRPNPSTTTTSTMNGKSTTIWEERYEELLAFRDRFGHLNVPRIYPENLSLGIWVSKQRQEYKRFQSMLSLAPDFGKPYFARQQQRIRQLNEIGFNWALKRGKKSKEKEEESCDS